MGLWRAGGHGKSIDAQLHSSHQLGKASLLNACRNETSQDLRAKNINKRL